MSVEELRDLFRTAPPMDGERVSNGLAVGSRAPEFTLPDADARPVSLADFRGRPGALVPALAAADRFANHLCVALGLDPARLLIAREDAFHYLWREQELPEHLDPQTAALDDSLERRRLARLLQQGLHAPTGLALPLGWDPVAERWRSSPWPLRRGQLILIPGDSPMGYRLPLDSLPQVTEAEAREAERDPFAPAKPLDADYHQYAQAVLEAAADRREIMAAPADPGADRA